MDIDLDPLKSEMLAFLDASGFTIFRGHPGGLEGLPMVVWDSERFPDYRMFLEAAQKVGAKLIVVATREFEKSEIEEAIDDLEGCDVTRDEYREYERRLHKFSSHDGSTCSLEIAFDHNSRMYIYEVHPDWYDNFLEIHEEIASRLPAGEDEEDDGSSGMSGFYSNN